MKKIYIVDAVRTGVGKFMGSLSSFEASDLGSKVIKSIIDRNKLASDSICEVIMGQVLLGGVGQNPARIAAMGAGIDKSIPAYTVSKVCGSGLKSILLASDSIRACSNELVIAGGQESMSKARHAAYIRSGITMGDSKLNDTMISDGLTDAFNKYHMGITAENIAKKYNISREEQDEFALNSQQKASLARRGGIFNDEIIPVFVKNKMGEVEFKFDEYIRDDTNIESFGKLKPAFDQSGTVTAGNASGLNDGAAALLIANENSINKFNLKPLVKIISYASKGVDPAYMGMGPVDASMRALEIAGWNIEDLDLIEANEAFAAQSIAVCRELKLDMSKVNVNGGAIAIGHPIGASGARVLTSLIYEMKRRNAKRGLATLCIGGGMGIAICIENI